MAYSTGSGGYAVHVLDGRFGGFGSSNEMQSESELHLMGQVSLGEGLTRVIDV